MLAWLFILPEDCLGTTNPVVINEIMQNPEGTDENNEWIELYNKSESDINLSSWDLDPDTGSYFSLLGKTIKAKDFLLIEKLKGLRNDYGQVSLYSSNLHTSLTIVDYIQYGRDDLGITENKMKDRAINAGIWIAGNYITNTSEGYSLELKSDGINNNPLNDWQKSFILGGTPGEKNSEIIIPPEPPEDPAPDPIPDPPKTSEYKIRLNEILANPAGSDTENEWFEIYNFGDTKVDLSKCTIKNKTSEKNLAGDIKSKKFKIFKKTISLLNSNGILTLLCGEPPQAIDSVSYVTTKENVSYNFNGNAWRWSQFLTPEAENKFNNAPTSKTKKDRNFYVEMYADFEAKGADADGQKLKYTWDFGDGHKSYLAKTRHKYKDAGKYTVTLKISDGSEDKIETYEIEVKKFPKLKVNILEIMPNPNGVDTGNEYIILENKEKKNINLNGWSIATGSKTLTNHPITKDLEIKKNKTLKLTQKFSKFSLVNTKGKVELRYPNGEVASKVKYDKGKKGTEENEVYTKIDKVWQWLKPANSKNDELVVANANDNIIEEILPEQIPETLPEIILKENGELGEEMVLATETQKTPRLLEMDKAVKYKMINYASRASLPEENLLEKNKYIFEWENKYYFLPPLPNKKHYLISFWENLQTKFSLFLN